MANHDTRRLDNACGDTSVSAHSRRRINTKQLGAATASAAAFGALMGATPAFAGSGTFVSHPEPINRTFSGTVHVSTNFEYVSGKNWYDGCIAVDTYLGANGFTPAMAKVACSDKVDRWSPSNPNGSSGYGRAWNRGGGTGGGSSWIVGKDHWSP
jgi:hypothetical protein